MTSASSAGAGVWRPSAIVPAATATTTAAAAAMPNGVRRLRRGRGVPSTAGATPHADESSASASSPAVANRSSGSVAIARATTAATASGTSGRAARGSGGGSRKRRAIDVRAPDSANGSAPVSISYSTQPSA